MDYDKFNETLNEAFDLDKVDSFESITEICNEANQNSNTEQLFIYHIYYNN